MDIIQQLAAELEIREEQALAAVNLIDEGNTVPFIARYRKEATGALNDEVLRNLHERLAYLRNLEDKKQQVIGSISEQGKLTPELEKKIREATTMVAVDDLYLPYRPKKKTRASIAKAKGLEPFATAIMEHQLDRPALEAATEYVNPELGVNTAEDALAGACDIIAESIAEIADYRRIIRKWTMKEGSIVTKAVDETADSVYEMYYDFNESVDKMSGYRVLAVNRGEKEKYLKVKLAAPDAQILYALEKSLIDKEDLYTRDVLKTAIEDGYKRLIAPAIERDVRNELTQNAQDGAITVFGKNLKQLLMSPPIKGQTVLGWDPAFRTGCKLAVVDPTGKVLDTLVIFPTEPQCKVAEAKAKLKFLINKYHISLISLGNGTASRESEKVIVELLKEIPQKVSYVIVSEAGASVYSASKLAAEEFPEFDVGQRSAASIARRLQDPLAELVKIEPKAIGVGQYQHDMNQKHLEEALGAVVEDCVNAVGVDLNTASASLLSYISGISGTVAKNIVSYREENGSFKSRKELLKVPKLGPKAFQQSAGFLRVPGGKELLDNTAVHPESYEITRKLMHTLTLDETRLDQGGISEIEQAMQAYTGKRGDAMYQMLAGELDVGELTLRDIVEELKKPARDPRNDMPAPVLRTDVMEMSDLKPGMTLKGTVRNVIDFGAFVDIGVHQDGLVHISEMTERYIKHPLEVVSVGDVVNVQVKSVDLKKKRIQLTMKIK